ncbi:MAG: hypothetical protein K8R02_04585 [Anaerohalosphaeraceae bacterium]|nr:hypothetical protein [Anaerohalosphaeraceae bacterium]
MTEDKSKYLFDSLQSLLEVQVEMARRGSYRKIAQVSDQAGTLVQQIEKIPEAANIKFAASREKLLGLYKKLELMLSAERDIVNKQLKQLNNGQKTVRTYRNSG